MFREIINTDFIKNKYLKWYINIIENAVKENRKKSKNTYLETHHILPKSLYPKYKNCKWNLVNLTLREHFICHWLLVKIHPEKYKMAKAFSGMILQNINSNKRIYTSYQYEIIRKYHIIALRMPCTQIRRDNISAARKNTIKTECQYCGKFADPGNFKLYHGDNCRFGPNKDIVIAARKEIAKRNVDTQIKNGLFKYVQDNVRNMGKDPHAHNTIIHTCPHCGKIGKGPVMKRHHYDNCKIKSSISLSE